MRQMKGILSLTKVVCISLVSLSNFLFQKITFFFFSILHISSHFTYLDTKVRVRRHKDRWAGEIFILSFWFT